MLRSAIQLDNADPWAHIYLGNVFVNSGRVSEAESEYLAALSQEPLWSEPRRLLGQLYSDEGRHHEAIAELERAVVDSPDDPESAYALALAFLESGNRDAARPWFERALALNPSQQTITAIRKHLQW